MRLYNVGIPLRFPADGNVSRFNTVGVPLRFPRADYNIAVGDRNIHVRHP